MSKSTPTITYEEIPLAIATRIKPGYSQGGKVTAASSKVKKGDTSGINCHVAHVGRFTRKTVARLGYKRITLTEVENFAEFDGPSAVQSAKDFVRLLAKGGTQASEVPRCVADGPPCDTRPAMAERGAPRADRARPRDWRAAF